MSIDLRKLNSLTKYPSIPTYHAIGEKGRLTEETVPLSGRIIAREKLDGTNARIIFGPGPGFILGSREELLYGRGDLIGNPALGIVEALRSEAERLFTAAVDLPLSDGRGVVVLYVEVYGGNVTAHSKQYTGRRAVGFRLFDVAVIPDWSEKLEWPLEQIAAWRDGGGQVFLNEEGLRHFAYASGLTLCPLVYEGDAETIPGAHGEVLAWLHERLPKTKAALDDSSGSRPEGVVIRTPDRKAIVKVRYEDYERTLRGAK